MSGLKRNTNAAKPLTVKRTKLLVRGNTLRNLAIAFAIVLLAGFIYIKLEPHTHDAKVRTELESKSNQLLETRQQLEAQKAKDAKTQKKIDEVNKKLKETQKQLQAKRSTPVTYAAPAPKVVGVTNCGDNPYKQFIYQHESGCRTDARNASSGACGIGQALPCSKLPCSSSDWNCQDKWFSNYAIQRYGSWKAAYDFWVANKWW